MQNELADEGHAVGLVAINGVDGAEDADLLTRAVDFPVFQDTSEVGAWGQHEGRRDDFFIYDAAGRLSRFLPFGEEIETDLRKAAGYEAIKAALVAALETTPPAP